MQLDASPHFRQHEPVWIPHPLGRGVAKDEAIRLLSVPRGPVTSARTMIRSPSISKGVSSLVIEDDVWSYVVESYPSSEVMADHAVLGPPWRRLVERLATRLAMSDNARRMKTKPAWMSQINLDDANMLFRIPLADLDPAQRLRNRRGKRFGGNVHHTASSAQSRLCQVLGSWQRRGKDGALRTRSPTSDRRGQKDRLKYSRG